MQIAELIDHLDDEGARFAAAIERAGLDAPVPRLTWTVRQLVVHLGGVHRWAADAIRTGARSADTPAAAAVGTPPPADVALPEWFASGHRELVEALRGAPHDLDTFTFLPADSPLHFWARRQAHETAIHRADADAAAGGGSSQFAADFAVDGIEELLHGFARRRSNRVERRASVLVVAELGDGMRRCWRLGYGGERIEVSDAGADAAADVGSGGDATVRGTASAVYRWMWNRSAEVDVHGAPDIADLFGRAVRVSWQGS